MKNNLQKAYFAAGCFWGVQFYFEGFKGVVSTTVGYMGGRVDNPTYDEVSIHETGHAESIEVVYDDSKVAYEELARLFFEIHDFTQVDRQGPDIGNQYRSVIFYNNEEQKNIAKKLIGLLTEKGYKVATEIEKAETFWPGEGYHQKYYEKRGGEPYCHIRKKVF